MEITIIICITIIILVIINKIKGGFNDNFL